MSIGRRTLGVVAVGTALAVTPGVAEGTWSVVAMDHETGRIVIASATCVSQEALEGFPSQGLRDIQAIAVPGEGGAVAQAGVDRTRENQELIHRHLERGSHPESIVEALHEDPDMEHRQFAVVDRQGRAATFTGEENGEAALAVADTVEGGGITFSVQGNLLAGEDVVTEGVDAFHAADGTLADRTMAAMEAADAAGGDVRCDCATEPVPDAPCDGRSAHVAYLMAVEEGDPAGDEPGDLTPSLLVDVTDQDIEPHENANPVKTLRMRYDEIKGGRGGEARPDEGLVPRGESGPRGDVASRGDAVSADDPFQDLAELTDLPDTPMATASSEFWEHWGDGRAELAGYHLQVRQYGELRDGELVTVYVTEPHDRNTWIKDDHVEEPDRVEVLKLLATRTFDTGIYPYTVLSGVFSPVDRWRDEPFQPVRLELDAQEWCGSESHRLWAGPERFRSLRLSYFDDPGESLDEVPVEEGALYEDALLVQLREPDGPFAEGEDWSGPLVPDLWRLRAELRPPEPVEASVVRSETVHDGTPATRFTLRAGPDDRYQRTFLVEREAPRRILEWTTRVDGEVVERAQLSGSTRLAYWELNRPGDEAHREALGLESGGDGAQGGAAPDAESASEPARGSGTDPARDGGSERGSAVVSFESSCGP